jgi:hypothetical protein
MAARIVFPDYVVYELAVASGTNVKTVRSFLRDPEGGPATHARARIAAALRRRDRPEHAPQFFTPGEGE